jgi:ribonuclease E
VDVATFLLNKKRADIHRIESRLKVSVMLIPNPHMETPNYTINRLRHDDLTADVLQASYKMVEKPAEDKPLTPAQEQQKAVRATAVVQGITPSQPAPVKAEEPKAKGPGLFGQIIGWFKSLAAEEEKPKPKAAAGKSRQRRERGERAERGEREGGKRRDRGDRGERGEGRRERGEKSAQAEGKQQEPRQQGEREPRQPKPPRPPRAAQAVEAEKPVLESQVAAPSAEQAEEGGAREGGRRRGRRGGRRERERRENGDVMTAEVGGEQVAPAAPARSGPTEYVAYPAGYVPPLKPTEYIAYPANYVPPAQPKSVAAPRPVAVAAPAAAAQGLVQIETDPNKFSAVTEAAPAGNQPVNRRRQRQREVYVENEPLVQIETQHTQD